MKSSSVSDSAENSGIRQGSIDGAHSAGESIVRRYRGAIRFGDAAERDFVFERHLLETSIREGVRVVPLLTYGDVVVDILDETSSMETGSIKAIDGCLAAAICRMEGIRRIAFESGGNTGAALTRYGRKAGLETFFFCPLGNVDLLDGGLFDAGRAHLVAVEDPGRVKELTGVFAETAGIRRVPDRSWRYAAGMFRGMFIREHVREAGVYDWISQAISAAFGPIGIYRILEAGGGEPIPLPRFLGVQQESNCPMVRAWRPGEAGRAGDPPQETGARLSRIMYDSSPGTHGTWEELQGILLRTGGDLLTVNGGEFDAYLGTSVRHGPAVDTLRSRGIAIATGSGGILDKTGMLALAGTLKAIDAGTIRPGERVLCALTGGTAVPGGRARPERTVRNLRDVRDYAEEVAKGR